MAAPLVSAQRSTQKADEPEPRRMNNDSNSRRASIRPAADPQVMPNRILRKPLVLERTGWSAPTLWRRVKDGSFPRPRRIGPRAVGWLESEVDDAIAAFPVANNDTREPWGS